MQRLHAEGSDHIWAYYSRNLVRPVALSGAAQGGRGDRQSAVAELQQDRQHACETERWSRRSKNDLRASGPAAGTLTHQDVAGLFFYAQRTDLYLKGGGVIGMVLPHSALRAGQYEKWRSGAWHKARRVSRRSSGSSIILTVDFGYKPAWDLEKLEPNTFFPMAAAVVFARRTLGGKSRVGEVGPLTGQVERWLGKTATADVRRVTRRHHGQFRPR